MPSCMVYSNLNTERAMGIGGFKIGCKLASAKSDSLKTTGVVC